MSEHTIDQVEVRPRRRRHGFLAGALLGVVAGGLAVALIAGPAADAAGRWHRRGGPMGMGLHGDPERAKQHLGMAADWIFERVDATQSQKADARSALDAAVDGLHPLVEQHRANREAVIEIFRNPEIDHVRLEDLRQSELVLADRVSDSLLRTAVEIAETLTPEQRAQLVEMAEHFHR